MRALITGIAGSGASYLAEFLLKQNIEVHGICRWHSSSSFKNIKNIQKDLILHECDLNDLSATIRALKESKPDYVFHLASHANVQVCFSNPIAVLQNNINCAINLFEALRILSLDPIVQFCSTSEVYGNVSKESCPITESFPLEPVNIYAVSKLTQEKIALSYFYSYKMRILITRAFAYINPRREDIFASAFAKKIVEIENNKRDVLTHGNLDSVRTLIDVRDMVEAYWMAVQKCEFGIPYNIGGNVVISVGEFLQKLIKRSKKKDIRTAVDPKLIRPVDVTMQIPDVKRFTDCTQWQPKIGLNESLDFLLDYYRSSLYGK